MQRFKNLKTMPKLMLSFGLLLAVTAFIGYLGITKLTTIDRYVEVMYTRDFVGLTEADALEIAKLEAARATRDAILHIGSPAAVDAAEQEFADAVGKMRAHAEKCGRLATQPRGKALVQTFKETLPAYEQQCAEVFRKAKARNRKAAIAALAAVAAPTKTLTEASLSLAEFKQQLAAQDKELSDAVYKSAWESMSGLLAGSILAGFWLAVWIARLFAKPLGATAVVLKRVAEGDLTQRLDFQSEDEIGLMADALNHALESMRSTLAEVTESASSLSAASQQLAAAATTMASGTQEQAASLEETSASLEEITATVRQNADSARQASQFATSSREAAEKGGAVVSDAVSAMSEINASSEKIADIIGTVDEIAFQTNLLAVNAAVEAARAGEQGRGFAVVASEVRSLAQRSAGAAKEIKALIGDSVRKAKNGSELVNRSGQTLHEIVSSVKRVTDIIGEIAAASHEQTVGVEQVNKAMLQMDQVTQTASAQTEELSSTAEALAAQARDLQRLVTRFVIDSKQAKPHVQKTATAAAQPAKKSAQQKLHTAPRLASTPDAKRIKPSREKTTESFVKLAANVPSIAPQARPISVSSADFEEF